MQTVSMIGVGRIGGGLAIALSGRGYEIENLVIHRRQDFQKLVNELKQKPSFLLPDELAAIKSDIIFITTPDSEIIKTAEKLAGKLDYAPVVLHTSGALSSAVLEALKKKNCPIGSMHPLVSVSDMFLAKQRFEGAYFAVEGDSQAVETAGKIVAELGGKPFSIETEYKTLYHAAAVTACGHLVAVIDLALEMLSKCGLDEKTGKKILMPLIKSTVENLETQEGTAQALTGTFARADIGTFKNHVRAIEENMTPAALDIYLQLGLRSLPLAAKQGANSEMVENLRRELLLAKQRGKC